MAREHDHSDSSCSPKLSRREFIIQLAALAAPLTGLLTGCSPSKQSAPTRPPTRPPMRAPAPTPVPAIAPTVAPTVVPTATPTVAPTTRPVPPRPAVIKFYPDVPSKVVRVRHAGVWDGDNLVPGVIRQMLDASITKLTGLNDANAAWAALFDSGERIAIKVNTIDSSLFWSHVPLVMAVAECLQEVGVPAEQIIVFDRKTSELDNARYSINQDGTGVRCYGTGSKYTRDWQVTKRKVGLSDILLSCDALINIPILKQHHESGFTFAMKNHYGTFDRPSAFHGTRMGTAIAELNALPPIRDRTRLVIGDALTVCPGNWGSAVPHGSALVSFDPVAHDTVGLQLLSELMVSDGRNPQATAKLANRWLTKSAELGLGTNEPKNVELVEVPLG